MSPEAKSPEAKPVTAKSVTAKPGGRPADPASTKRAILAGHAFFEGLPEADVAAVAQTCRFQTAKVGETLFNKGDPGLGMIAVVAGTVRIASVAADGREATLNTIRPGEIFGEIALLDGRPRTASAIAAEPCELLVLRRDEFLPLMRERPAISENLLKVLCAKLRRASEQVEDSHFLPMSARLAKAVLRMSKEGGEAVRITQRELGHMIGLSRETTNKMLGALADGGALRIGKASIAVLDRAALERAALGLD